MNKMQEVKLEKAVLNIGVGETGQKVDNAMTLLKNLTGKQPTGTKVHKHVRIPTWGLRPGLKIGAKVTVRGQDAIDVTKKLLAANKNEMYIHSFSHNGNVSFGVKEYIDVPGLEYDPKIGIMGLEIALKISRPGERINKRKIKRAKVPMKQRVSKEESMDYMKKTFNVTIEEKKKGDELLW